MVTEASTRASSSTATAKLTKSRPAPPYSAGKGSPKIPSCRSFCTSCRGNSPLSSRLAAPGLSSVAANSLTVNRKASCSLVSSSSISSPSHGFVLKV